jgi:hydroxymethylbilane synthase
VNIRIATRRSPLALWQAEHVAALLRAAAPVTTELVGLDTKADLDQRATIREIGGKGAFSKEVQALVLAGRADIAVHSAKDLQAITPPGLVIGAFPERGTAEDCLVGGRLADLAVGATVATGSNRRRVLLADLRPDLTIVELRGNIGTRLRRLDDVDVDAVVMAAVALERLGETPPVVDRLDPETFVPQVGQGALAVECRADDHRLVDLLAAIDHETTRAEVTAERSFLAELGGGCELPAGANAVQSSDGKLTIRGVLAQATVAGGWARLGRAEVVELPAADPGRTLAKRLLQAAEPGDAPVGPR